MMTEAMIIERMYQDLQDFIREDRRQAHMAKMRAVQVQNAQQRGYYIGGRPPFGYRWDNGQLIPYAPELEIIVLVQQLRNNGFSYPEIAKTLAAKGYRNRYGNPFPYQNIFQMLNVKKKSTQALLPRS